MKDKQHVRMLHGEVVISRAVMLHAALAGAYAPDDMTDDGRVSSTRIAEALLAAAFDGGFSKSDILRTLIATDTQHNRIRALIIEADQCIGNERFTGVLRGLGVDLQPLATKDGGAA